MELRHRPPLGTCRTTGRRAGWNFASLSTPFDWLRATRVCVGAAFGCCPATVTDFSCDRDHMAHAEGVHSSEGGEPG